ncbi:hypothetical protein GCM10007242_35750 [Pigmentiphaga litoralis]|nr:hypothetical protein GCM10007242_35750 [Pigmentiphaga litoralis]
MIDKPALIYRHPEIPMVFPPGSLVSAISRGDPSVWAAAAAGAGARRREDVDPADPPIGRATDLPMATSSG